MARLCSFWSVRRESFSLASPASRGLLHSLGQGLLPSSSKQQCRISLSLASLSNRICEMFSTFKRLMRLNWAHPTFRIIFPSQNQYPYSHPQNPWGMETALSFVVCYSLGPVLHVAYHQSEWLDILLPT